MDKGRREPGGAGVLLREPGRGLLWCAGMFGLGEAFHGEVLAPSITYLKTFGNIALAGAGRPTLFIWIPSVA
jgi:hypothetical protein